MVNPKRPQRVLFLMSDTGGGHRAAAEAIQAAMEDEYPGQYEYVLVDVFRDYTPFPFNQMPEFYPVWVNHSKRSWQFGYMLTNARRRSKLILDSFHLSWRNGLKRLFEQHEADIVVSVHTLFTRPALRTLNNQDETRPPFITVVTDLVSTHAFAYENQTDLTVVPTLAAYKRGLKYGMQADKMRITGLPVHPNFVKGLMSKEDACASLQWDPAKPAVLMVSGGQGVGPMLETARAINAQKLDIQLAIIAGSNKALKRELEAQEWHQPTFVYPFVSDMARYMAAADILITKAGPATVSEACVAGLPMIISGYIPGQEDGNVAHIVEHGAGVFAPSPYEVAKALAKWVNQPPEVRHEYAEHAAQLGRPEAAWTIARIVHDLAEQARSSSIQIKNQKKNSESSNDTNNNLLNWSLPADTY